MILLLIIRVNLVICLRHYKTIVMLERFSGSPFSRSTLPLFQADKAQIQHRSPRVLRGKKEWSNSYLLSSSGTCSDQFQQCKLSIPQTSKHCSQLSSPGLSYSVSLAGATWVSWDKEVTVLAGPPQLLQPEQQPPLATPPSPLPPLSSATPANWQEEWAVSENTSSIMAEWRWDLHCSATSSHQFWKRGNPSLLSWIKSTTQVSPIPIFRKKNMFYQILLWMLPTANSRWGYRNCHILKKNHMRNSFLHSEKQFILHHFKK